MPGDPCCLASLRVPANAEPRGVPAAMETGGSPIRSEESATDVSSTPQPPNLLVETICGREAFLKLKSCWVGALAAGPDPAPALEHDFLRLWLETFAASKTPLTFVARRQHKIAGAIGVLIDSERVDGIPVSLAQAWTNPHSTRGGILLGRDGPEAVPALVRRLAGEPWDVLTLRDVPREHDELDQLTQALRQEGCTVTYESPMDSPYVPLPATWEELEKRLDARFRQNLRRRRRRLEEHGPVRLEVIEGAEGLDAALEDAFAIEAAGWKGQEGSAIRARPELVSFYASWARRLARQRQLRLCFLVSGDRRIAFQFGFVSGGRYWLPKCAFDESMRECSPGQLLMVEVLKRCISERLDTFEFLGFNMPWKRDWTPLVHPHATLWAFRPTWRGRLAWLTRAMVRPLVARAWRALQTRLHRTGEAG